MRNIILFIISIQFLISCKPKHSTSALNSSTDTSGFIRLEDTKTPAADWSKENVVIVHTIADPDDMHPSNGTTAIRAELNLYTQQFLTQTDLRTSKLRAGLCKSLPEVSANGLEFIYELRDEPQWDNGDSLTVNDIIFTVKASKCVLTNNHAMKPYWESVKDLIADKTNQRKFKMVMKQTYIQNVAFWSDYPIMQAKYHDPENILSHYTIKQFNDSSFNATDHKDLVKWALNFNDAKYGHDINFMNGLGMYKITSWEPGQSITLTRKENHWTKNSTDYFESSYPEKIIYKINRDATAQMLEFKSQTMDASGYIGNKTLFELQADEKFNKNYHSRFIPTYAFTFLSMNTRPDGTQHHKLFIDKKVRRAMALLTPCDNIIKIINKGVNKRIPGPVSLLKPDFNNQLTVIPFDIKQASQLLDESGWKDTDGDNIRDKIIDGEKIKFEFNLNYLTTQTEWKDMAMMIAEAMLKAGIQVNLTPMDQTILFTNARNHDYDMMMGSFANSALPEDFTQLWHTQSWVTNGMNYSGFGDAKSDALIDSIKVTLDDANRNEMTKRLQAIIYDEQPFVFLYNSVRRNILHKRFNNVEFYYDRPGMLFNNLRVIGVASKDDVSAN